MIYSLVFYYIEKVFFYKTITLNAYMHIRAYIKEKNNFNIINLIIIGFVK